MAQVHHCCKVDFIIKTLYWCFHVISFNVSFCVITFYINYFNTITIVLERDTFYICSYTRHYITMFIRMMSIYAPLFVSTPLSHVHKHKADKRRDTFKPHSCLTMTVWEAWHSKSEYYMHKYSMTAHVAAHVIRPACQPTLPTVPFSVSIVYFLLFHINSLTKSTWRELNWQANCMLNFQPCSSASASLLPSHDLFLLLPVSLLE